MNFSFVLPLQNSDLLNSSGDNYYVKHFYKPEEVPEKLQECKTTLYKDGPFFILDHFDTFYSIIEYDSTDTNALTNLLRAFDLLYVTVDKLGQRLTPILSVKDAHNIEDRSSYLNLIKMIFYLFANTVKRVDTVMHKRQQEQNMNAQKKRGKQQENQDHHFNWDSKRGKFLVQLYNILQFPLEKLWLPPVVEDNFVNLLMDVCYRTIEIVPLRSDNKHIVETVFQIFGTTIKRYNHAITFPVRILQILRSTEHTSNFIANGISILNEECGITSVFSVLIKDIVETLSNDSTDTAVSRNFSNFLTELASVSPKLMIPHLSTLSEELLNCESHVLRNCLLQIMGDAIVGELTSEELSNEMKEARDDFLDLILSHIHDVSAHVRAKVLQIWHHLKQENAVPLSIQLKVLCESVDRLEDKTSIVRKQALQLIKAFLECNPFAAKLSFEELVKKHEEECKIMESLSEKLTEERKKAEQLEQQWNGVISDIFPFIEENLTQATQDVCETETQENYEDLVRRISELLLSKKYKEAVILVRKADAVAGNSELRHSLSIEEQCAYYLALLKSYMFLANGCKSNNEELGTQIKTVQFLQDSIEFSKVLTRAVPKVLEMLQSKTNSDVFEAVDLFTTGYLFKIKGMEAGMQQMLLLVWSPDKEKRDAVSNAYKKVLFTTDLTGRAHAIKVVQNLSDFLRTLEYGHYTAMEYLMREWISTDDIDALIIQVLFERFTLKLEGTSNVESRLSLQLLIMCSMAKSSIASANINIIESIGFGERGRRDPRIYTSCLEFLINSIDPNTISKFYKRYEYDNTITQTVITMFQGFFFHPRIPNFEDLAVKTFEFFYCLCQQPDIICQNIIFYILKKMKQEVKKVQISATQSQTQSKAPLTQSQMPLSQSELPLTQTQETVASQPVRNKQTTSGKRMPVFLLTRFVYIIGYITLKEMIFLDIDVYNNMKYRQELSDCEKKKKQFNYLLRTTNLNMSATESLKRLSGTAAEPQQEPDEDLVGATAEDNIAELIGEICEEILLYDKKGLLRVMITLVLEICQFPGKYRSKPLQQAATLTLIRFMCVSSQFCNKYMQLLMNILNKSKNIPTKCNIVVGLSDLTFRFPNVIEPWTGYLYNTLHEENTAVRLTAVKMISNLILHEMIRVKGQIADLVMCIVDSSDEIKNITRQFFKEIANKSNILYNVLPDIISKLGDIEANVEEEKYHIIMTYIIGLIQKDRQVETLVEKLCLRFQVAREERQWRDTAFCLSLLSYNEKTIKKLIDNIKYYRDKVQVDEVYNSFKHIISNTSKLAKPELKALVTELETRIEECLQVNDDIDENDPNNENNVISNIRKDTNNQPKGKPKQKKTGTRKKRATRVSNSSDEANTDTESDITPRKEQNKGMRNKQKNTQVNSISTESDSDDAPINRKSTNKNNTRNQSILSKGNTKERTKVIMEYTTSSGDEQPQKRKRGRPKQF